MNKPTESVSFPCREKDCTGTITNDPQFLVSIKTSCCGSSRATRCPVCGRLHWPDSGEPVQSRSFQKVFCVDGDLENRPLESAGRLNAVRELLAGADKKELILDYYHGHLTYLHDLGHATDCPALTSTGNCACGHTEAEKWLVEHPLEAETA